VPLKRITNKSTRRPIFAAVLGGVGLLCLLWIVIAILHGEKPSTAPGSERMTVFTRGETALAATNRYGEISLKGIPAQAYFTDDGAYLFYDAEVNGTMNLYRLSISSKKSRKAGGELILRNVTKGWIASADGAYVYFVRQGSVRLWRAADSTDTQIQSGGQMYGESGSKAIFLTAKSGGGVQRIQRIHPGQEPQEIAAQAAIVSFHSQPVQELLLKVPNADTTQSLQIVTADGAPTTIAAAVTEIADNYTPGGNLYYLSSIVPATDTTETPAAETEDESTDTPGSKYYTDSYKEADARIKKPNRTDYPNGWLTSWGGDLLYENDMKSYRAKERRDSARQAVEVILSDPTSVTTAASELCVWTGKMSYKLTENILSLQFLNAYTLNGSPAIVYHKYLLERTEQDKPSVEELAALLESGGQEAVRERILGVKSDPADLGMWLLRIVNGSPVEVALQEKSETGEWSFAFINGGNTLLALQTNADKTTSSLYASAVTETAMEPSVLLNAAVRTDNWSGLTTDGLYYKSSEDDGTQALYWYNGLENKELFRAANMNIYVAPGTDKALLFADMQAEAAHLWLCENGEAEELASQAASPILTDTYCWFIRINADGTKEILRRGPKQSARIADNADALISVWEEP
jgi:hypothetical protein